MNYVYLLIFLALVQFIYFTFQTALTREKYVSNPGKRGLGVGLTLLPNIALVAGAIIGLVLRMVP